MTENPYPVKSQRPQIQSQDVNPISMMFDPVIADWDWNTQEHIIQKLNRPRWSK